MTEKIVKVIIVGSMVYAKGNIEKKQDRKKLKSWK